MTARGLFACWRDESASPGDAECQNASPECPWCNCMVLERGMSSAHLLVGERCVGVPCLLLLLAALPGADCMC